jgi:transcriptional regulator with XRE-family HTH domain
LNIKQLRKDANIKTGKEAANLLGISYSMLHKIEEGVKLPGRDLIKKMAEVYKCDVSTIYSALDLTNGEQNNKT